MRELTGENLLLRIFLGESDHWHQRSLMESLVQMFRERGLAGATVLRGIEGFGAHSHTIHRDSILRLSSDLPIVIEVVDEPGKIEAILPELDSMMDGGMVTMEKVQVIRYSHHRSRS